VERHSDATDDDRPAKVTKAKRDVKPTSTSPAKVESSAHPFAYHLVLHTVTVGRSSLQLAVSLPPLTVSWWQLCHVCRWQWLTMRMIWKRRTWSPRTKASDSSRVRTPAVWRGGRPYNPDHRGCSVNP
jgi:hypothetical protein